MRIHDIVGYTLEGRHPEERTRPPAQPSAPVDRPASPSATGSKPGTTAAGSTRDSDTNHQPNARITTVTPPTPRPHDNVSGQRGELQVGECTEWERSDEQ